jgi:5-methylcytosine-specific restriction enzyme A
MYRYVSGLQGLTRKSLTAKERLRLFTLHGGVCHLCGQAIDGTREKWDVEHVVAWALTRDDSDENRRPAHVACHKVKTVEDVGRVAKAKRQEAKYRGAHRSRSPMPGSKRSIWKKRMDGTVVRREEE